MSRTDDEKRSPNFRLTVSLACSTESPRRRIVDESGWPFLSLELQAARHAVPTYADLHTAIDGIGVLLKKYSSLLHAAILATLTPVDQADWKAAFRVPWLREAEGAG